ncbi:fibropellin-1 isoform X2 [Patella vulgata]|uniref:fibropellin-1 isoform X2 n=1 Tax=Patella vulgata TaxID=6465 RepID=UPI0021807306|nr:fibropellin-1 isoform X2 [Patella vulgata]
MKMVAPGISTALLVFVLWVNVSHGVEVVVEITCNKACLNGGQCVLLPDPYSGFKQTCTCPLYYTGVFCEKFALRVNCDKACENGGQCVVNVTENTYTLVNNTCVCLQNYHGDLCQTFVPSTTTTSTASTTTTSTASTTMASTASSSIAPSPNVNSMTSTAMASTAVCDPPCTAGHGECVVLRNSQLAPHLTDQAYCNCSTSATGYYYGKQCEHYQQNITCEPSCKNGGECSVTGRCNCIGTANGYDPGDCSRFSAEPCNPACENGGSCLGGVCQCKSTNEWDYSGSHCEQAVQCIPACVDGECRSFGYNSTYCSCNSNSTGYYEGPTCDTFTPYINDVTDTCSEPCENGGTCGVYSNKCRCKSNGTHYTSGPTCSQVQECIGGCLNGGVCGNGSTCLCTQEYTGAYCETYIGCPCQNNGTCFGKYCGCPSNSTGHYYGQICEQFAFEPPCYPSVLNGGLCFHQSSACPYDDIGYFHGDQCEQYSKHNCSSICVEPYVCVAKYCTCPYNLAEGYSYYDVFGSVEKCSGKYYLWYEI